MSNSSIGPLWFLVGSGTAGYTSEIGDGLTQPIAPSSAELEANRSNVKFVK